MISMIQTHQAAVYYRLKGWQCITTCTIRRQAFFPLKTAYNFML